jgi:hypothetical protein
MAKEVGNGKLLVVILAGPDDPERIKWGLRLALHCHSHPYGERLLNDVKVLLFGAGVSIIDPQNAFYAEFKERILALTDAGVEVAVCVSIASALGLEKQAEDLGLDLAHASVYTAKQVSRGYTIFSF